MTDVTHEINAARRSLSRRTLPAGEARVLTISRTYDAPLEAMWDACTNAERIPRWFLPVSGDLRLGGRYQFEGNAGGVVERCDPPKSFAATWEMGDDISWIEVRLHPVDDGRTRFELEHVAHVDDERWTQFGPGAVGIGWEMGLFGLSNHFKGSGITPEQAAEWMATEEARRFITQSSEAWVEADIAAGTDEARARAAGGRTTAAYTGMPVE
ncbi:SRPBCC family protein [Micromonospora sp. NPDC050686]|uniref:SRPBCC family protein n=1 Tax=Micromonospora sp. NPDC050686 TaxID=3154631 RepID=UPI003402CBF9